MAVAGTVLVLMAGGVAAAVAMNRVDTDPPTGQSDGTVPDGAASAAPAAADPGSVLAAPDTQVPAVENRLAMAGRTGGVQISRLGEVDSVGSGDAERSAPEGGRLIAFRLGRWPCGSGSCRTWDELALQVDVDGERRPLPTSGDVDTFVVAVPGDAEDVDLVLRSDGLTQSLSLVDQRPGRDNIAVLARSGRVDRVGAHFTLTERTSTAFDYGDVVTDTVPRAVRVSNAELMWFAGKARPSSPERAFLKVRVDYTIPYGAGAGDRYAFELREMSFVGADGTTYRARDLDDGPGIDAVFEVPAGLKAGRLVLGGGSYVAQSEDGPFTRTLAERTVRLRFG
jgi:hypothetical protein